MTRVVLVVWLTLLWVVLWREVSLANLASGLAIAAVVLLVFPPRQAEEHDHRVRPLRLLAFLAYFGWQVLVSNLVVAREIVTRRDRISSGIVAVPMAFCSDLVITVVANAITLTPGTLTVELRRDPTTLYVHVLHLSDLDQVRRDIRTLQRKVVRAIGSAHALALLDASPLPTVEDTS